MNTQVTSDDLRPRQGAGNRRGMLGLGLGNTVEWYDWMLFGLLATYLGPHFFPSADPVSATLSALAVFAVGFAVRPLGGVLLGTVADRVGRRKIMLLSIIFMVVTTIVIAFIPTYDSIGMWAGVILVLCRLLQGISTGIEAPLSTAYAIELMPAGREGQAGGYINFFVNLGLLLASLTSFSTTWLIGPDAMEEWGWRVPFIFGAVLGIVVLYMRRALPETLPEKDRSTRSTSTVWQGVGRHKLGLLAMMFGIGAVQAFNYAWNVGLPNIARTSFGEDPTMVFAITTGVSLVLMIGAPLTGRLADRVTLSRTFVVTRLLAVPTVLLMLLYHQPGILGLAAVMLGGSIVLALNMSIYIVVSSSLMPTQCRVTGVALGYGVAVALFGGTASYLQLWLHQHGIGWMFPVYVAILILISVSLYVAARRRGGTYLGE